MGMGMVWLNGCGNGANWEVLKKCKVLLAYQLQGEKRKPPLARSYFFFWFGF
jgi:hypothetical protein